MNPVSDMERVLSEYKIEIPVLATKRSEEVSDLVKQLVGLVKAEQTKCRMWDWARNRSMWRWLKDTCRCTKSYCLWYGESSCKYGFWLSEKRG